MSHSPLSVVVLTVRSACPCKLKNYLCLHEKNVQISGQACTPANHAILKVLDQNNMEMEASVVKALEAHEELQQFEKVKGHMENW